MDFRGKNIDLVGKKNLWFGISAVLVLVSLICMLAPNIGMNYGIDFRGGGQLKYLIPDGKKPTGDDVGFINATRSALEAKGLGNARIQIAGGDTLVIVTDATDNAGLESQQRIVADALKTQLGSEPQLISRELVGPVIGKELKRNAFIGVILGVLLIAGWIYIRYNFAGDGLRYAVAGIFALVHDAIVLVGIFALIGKIDPRVEVDGTFIAALLTVVGYSINDSVVIFDRIRENLRKRGREEFSHVVNESLLETMSRSINTGLTVLIMLVVMLFFGGESIYNFILAMLIGMAVGLYSSIFNASMILVVWHDRETKKLGLASAGSTPAVATRSGAAALKTPPRVSAPKPVATPKPSAETPGVTDSGSTPDAGKAPSSSRPPTKARSRKRF
jgi:preprotein translocase subunit SecF